MFEKFDINLIKFDNIYKKIQENFETFLENLKKNLRKSKKSFMICVRYRIFSISTVPLSFTSHRTPMLESISLQGTPETIWHIIVESETLKLNTV